LEIIDSHTHWGLSASLGFSVTTGELLRQAEQSGVDRIVIFPFPSQALALGLPLIVEEALEFTVAFAKRSGKLNVIIPHLGMLGGNPLDFLAAFKKHEHVLFE